MRIATPPLARPIFPAAWVRRSMRATCLTLLVLTHAQLAAAAPPPTIQFALQDPAPTGAGPVRLAVGDLNRDGWPDLVVVNSSDATLSVLLSLGIPGLYQPAVPYVLPPNSFDVVIADVTLDGRPDILVINTQAPFTLTGFLGIGDGTFEPAGNYPLALEPHSLAVADLNRDGMPDFVIADTVDTVTVLVSNVSAIGTFLSAASYTVGSSPGIVRIGDFNGDGVPDLAVTNTASSTISVLLGKGDGTFGAAVPYASATSPLGLVLGDFNRDGLLDLAAATSNSAVTVHLGNSSAPGTFGAAVSYTVGAAPNYGLEAADFDGNGTLDLVITDADGSVVVLSGHGDGTFGAPAPFAAGVFPFGVAVADLDNDGRVDIVAADLFTNSLAILLNVTLLAPSGTAFAHSVFPMGDGPQSVAVGDFNRDGIPDVVTAGQLAATSSVTLRLGNADGTLASATTTLPGPVASPASVAAGDVNGDGRLDVLWMNAGNGTLSVALGHGDGTFQAPLATAVQTSGPSYIALGDFDRDGLLDVAVSKRNGGRVSVLLGNGDGTFARTDYTAGAGARIVAVGDLDGDGTPDLAVANPDADTVSVLLNTGDGTFAANTDYAMGAGPRAVALGDMNTDGFLDMVTANAASFSVRLGNGDGTFGPSTDVALPAALNNVVIADMNRDGVPDLVLGAAAGKMTIMHGSDGTSFVEAWTYTPSTGRLYVAVADMDRDGRLDIVTANRADSTTSVLLNRATAFAFSAPIYTTPEGPGLRTVFISVYRLGDTSSEMTVDFAVAPGTAAEDEDYTATGGTLTFAVGDTVRTFTVSILDDTTTEGAETILLSLADSSGDAVLGLPSTATLKIAANDRPRVHFSSPQYSVDREQPRTRTITVRRTHGFGTTVTVNYATSDGTATENEDYEPASGTLTFGPAETTKSFTVTILHDDVPEVAETINLTLSSPSPGALLGAHSTAVLTIAASD